MPIRTLCDVINEHPVRNFLLKAIKFFAAALLLPLFPPTAIGIWHRAASLGERTLFLANPLSLCLGGVILWGLLALFFHFPARIYIFCHEMTHALFVKLFGGSVKKISIGSDRGHVISDLDNFLITLAPYIFPFYAMLWGAIFGGATLIWRHPALPILFWTGFGTAMGYHWGMTFRMLGTRQTDFSSQGYFFSFVLILLGNMAWLHLLLTTLPSPSGFGRAWIAWGRDAVVAYRLCFNWLAGTVFR